MRLYMEGNSLRAIGRILKVNHQTVANWINAYTAILPAAELPERPKVAELDELYTFIGQKKMKSMS
jgi:transposase